MNKSKLKASLPNCNDAVSSLLKPPFLFSLEVAPAVSEGGSCRDTERGSQMIACATKWCPAGTTENYSVRTLPLEEELERGVVYMFNEQKQCSDV